jgi:hypothetical protein
MTTPTRNALADLHELAGDFDGQGMPAIAIVIRVERHCYFGCLGSRMPPKAR